MVTRTKLWISPILPTWKNYKGKNSSWDQTQLVQIKPQSSWGLPRNVSPTYHSAFCPTERWEPTTSKLRNSWTCSVTRTHKGVPVSSRARMCCFVRVWKRTGKGRKTWDHILAQPGPSCMTPGNLLKCSSSVKWRFLATLKYCRNSEIILLGIWACMC